MAEQPTSSRTDSLGKRYAVKLVSNIATIPLFFILESVLPRALGPAVYGNFTFATTMFQQSTQFLDMGTSTCLHTTLSRRQGEIGLVAFYGWCSLLMLALCLLWGGACSLPWIGGLVLPDVPLWFALPAALWAYLSWGGRVVRGINDALGITSRSEMVRIVVNIASALVLCGLFYLGWLSLPVLILHQYIFFILFILGFIFTLRGAWPSRHWRLGKSEWQGYVQEFIKYSGPLFTMALFSALFISGERWLLQRFSGSIAQGYFSLSQKVGMACFMFVTAMTPLIMRELAVAHGKKDTKAMGALLDRYGPMIYAVAGFFSCFTLVEAEAVTRLFGGAGFTEAMLPVQIMALYPMHQGYGQVANSVYYATGDTKELRTFTLWSLVLGLVVAWVLLAPQALWGFDLGAIGLACKMVAVQFLAVNGLLFFCRRKVPFAFWRNIAHQCYCPIVFISIAFAGQWASRLLGVEQWLLRLGVSGCVYTLLLVMAVCLFPPLAGLRVGELRHLAQKLLQRGGKR